MPDGLDKQKVEGVVYTDKLDVPEKTRAPNRRVEIFVKP